MDVCCERCMSSGRVLCDGLITRPEESYRLWCVVVCDLETSKMRRPWPRVGITCSRKCFVASVCILIMKVGSIGHVGCF